MKNIPLFLAIFTVTAMMALQAATKPSEQSMGLKSGGESSGVCSPSPTAPPPSPGQG